MERKRSWSRCICDEEEEEEQEECNGRRRSLREKKRVFYVVDEKAEQEKDGGGDADDDDSEEEEYHSILTSGNRLLPVTCGAKKGKLDVEKLKRGEECIECEGKWFSPNAFESFCGKSAAKKWKTSIVHGDKPLQFWFEQGCLSTKGYKKGTRRKEKRMQPSDGGSETSSEEDSETQSTKETEDDDRKNGCRLRDSKKLLLKKEKEIKDENESDEGAKTNVQKSEPEDEGFAEEKNKKWTVASTKILALKTHVKVVINRLNLRGRTSSMDSPPEVKWLKPLDEDVNCGGETENSSEEENNMDIAEATPDEAPDSDSTIITDDEELMNSPSAVLDSPPDPVVTEEDSDLTDVEKEDGELEMLDRKKENQTKRKEHLDVSASEDSITSRATGKRRKTSSVSSTGEEVFQPLCLSITPPDILDECASKDHTDVTTSDPEATPLQVMVSDTGTHGKIRAPDCPSSSRVLSGSEEDTMDMNQLKKEITYMQLKVLKLQEEYYTLKLRDMKKKQQHADTDLSTLVEEVGIR